MYIFLGVWVWELAFRIRKRFLLVYQLHIYTAYYVIPCTHLEPRLIGLVLEHSHLELLKLHSAPLMSVQGWSTLKYFS